MTCAKVKVCVNITLSGLLEWGSCLSPDVNAAVYYDGSNLHSVRDLVTKPCLRYCGDDPAQTPRSDLTTIHVGII